jgi:hypothetical protein
MLEIRWNTSGGSCARDCAVLLPGLAYGFGVSRPAAVPRLDDRRGSPGVTVASLPRSRGGSSGVCDRRPTWRSSRGSRGTGDAALGERIGETASTARTGNASRADETAAAAVLTSATRGLPLYWPDALAGDRSRAVST